MNNQDLEIIIEASAIPDGETVSKETGRKEYKIQRKFVVYNKCKEKYEFVADPGTVFLFDGSKNINSISANKKLKWYTNYRKLKFYMEHEEDE